MTDLLIHKPRPRRTTDLRTWYQVPAYERSKGDREPPEEKVAYATCTTMAGRMALRGLPCTATKGRVR